MDNQDLLLSNVEFGLLFT